MASLVSLAAHLILQAPPSVFEGDPLTLTCREKPDLSLKTRTLYKNDNKLIDLGKNSSFHIKHAGLKDNGEYRCTGFGTHCAFSSNAVRIQVQGKALVICEEAHGKEGP